MKITTDHTHNQKIEIINLHGELTGNAAIELQKYFYDRLDEGNRYYVINLKHVMKIDGLGINVLSTVKYRGMHIGLFNIVPDIRWMLRISGNEGLFKIYNETNSAKVVSMFGKEMLGKGKTKDNPMMRQSPRIDTCFQAEFKYNPARKGVILCRANVLNLSKGGFFADNILAFNEKTKEIVNQPEISGHELYDLKFKIKETSDFIETKGEVARLFKTFEKLSAGIRFKGMKQKHKEMIRDYVFNNLWSKIVKSHSVSV